MELVEPIPRKLIRLGKIYLSVLAKNTRHLDINRYHYMLTLICFYDGKLTQKALAKIMEKDKSSIVGIIDMLSERGYVNREINPADRREHLITVTEKAKKEVPQIVNAFNDINKQISSGITDEEMEVFEKVVNKMQQNLKSSAIQ